MPQIYILVRSISEYWEDLLLGAYTDYGQAKAARECYLTAVRRHDPWQACRSGDDWEAAVQIRTIPYHGEIVDTLYIAIRYEECFGQTDKTPLAAFPSEAQAEQYGRQIETQCGELPWPAWCDVATIPPNHLSPLPKGWSGKGQDSDYPYFELQG